MHFIRNCSYENAASRVDPPNTWAAMAGIFGSVEIRVVEIRCKLLGSQSTALGMNGDTCCSCVRCRGAALAARMLVVAVSGKHWNEYAGNGQKQSLWLRHIKLAKLLHGSSQQREITVFFGANADGYQSIGPHVPQVKALPMKYEVLRRTATCKSHLT